MSSAMQIGLTLQLTRYGEQDSPIKRRTVGVVGIRFVPGKVHPLVKELSPHSRHETVHAVAQAAAPDEEAVGCDGVAPGDTVEVH